MSFVVEAIEEIGGFVEDVVEEVGDVVQDVGKAIENVVQTVAENPEILVIAIVAPQVLPAIGVPAVAVQPVTAALISASQGGDIEDIGKAALTAYVAPQVARGVGGAVAAATEGSALQNTLASAAGSAAASAVGAAITGGDIGESAILGAAGGAGGSIARDIATSVEYGTTPFSEQTAALSSQDFGLNPVTEFAAGAGATAGRIAAGADTERELESFAQSSLNREISRLVDQAVASSKGAENEPAKNLVVSEIQDNPNFRDQLQIAMIANAGQPLSMEQQIDTLAETYARQIFDEAAAMSAEDVAALPAVVPIAGVAARAAAQAAARSAPELTKQIARFAANDPRFAQVMATNPYVQSLLAAAGITISVTQTGDTLVNPVQTSDQSPAETARLARQAVEIQKVVPNANQTQIRNLENIARRADYEQYVEDLQTKSDQGYNVQRELNKAQQELARLPQPEIAPTPEFYPEEAPQVLPSVRPSERSLETPYIPVRPGQRPGTRPTARTEPINQPSGRTEIVTEPVPIVRPNTRLEPSPTAPSGPTRPSVRPPVDTTPTETGRPTETPTDETISEQPISIEDLVSDEEIMSILEETFGGEPTPEEIGTATKENFPSTLDLAPTVTRGTPSTITREPRSISPRVTGEALSGLLKPKEPLFGGDEDAQRAVWNRRSLRLRRSLGI